MLAPPTTSSAPRRRDGESSPWLRARCVLASEILDAAEELGGLRRLQADVLIPLELELAGWCPPAAIGSTGWVFTVLERLCQYRRAKSGPIDRS